MLGMMKIAVTVEVYRCERCGHVWQPRRAGKPRRCGHCKSPYWDRPKKG